MKWRQISFRKRMLIIMTLSGLIELLILSAAGFAYIKHSQEKEIGLKALGVASFLAKSDAVVNLIETRDFRAMNSADVQDRYRKLTEMIGAAFIVIGDDEGVRLVHPVDHRLGKPMKGGDNALMPII
ncbi:hypothetical protein A130_07650 [Vibrio genomosp. F6 str. FF-238]|uniref:Histidine kinase n=1 Tax=Vibrio genomosp. F6 str. FF-238 TaxID=1191298 RepID=A0A1E5CP11_9VIBR|nr:hypothetical protein A130_07650 [Vibrio genomosp. F6 str. FF-238]